LLLIIENKIYEVAIISSGMMFIPVLMKLVSSEVERGADKYRQHGDS
jgi:hypothetical protein